MTELSKRQVDELQRAWRDLRSEPDATEVPDTADAVCRTGLDAWLAGVISSDGRLTSTALGELLDLEREATDLPRARDHVSRVVNVVVPRRDEEPRWFAELDVIIRAHCREHGYQVSDARQDGAGYLTWHIEVPSQQGPVQLTLNGEVFLLTFPGGFTWPEFGYAPGDAAEALQDQLHLLDAYAAPGTRMVSVKRRPRPSRTELHLSDGTVLWRRGGRRART